MIKPKLEATITKKTPEKIYIEINKNSFEKFCDAAGFYKKNFIELLDKSEEDHKKGRITKRKTLAELFED